MCVLEGKCETCRYLVETPEAHVGRAACSLAFHRQDLDADGSLQRIPLAEVQSCHFIGHRFALIACERVYPRITLTLTTDSVNSAVVCSMTSRVEGQPMPHSPTTGGRDHQRATGFR